MSYAKLLEGQRYYEAVRSGTLPVNYLERAQEAFQKSAEFDPSFAEAHTAIAEIAFLLDDFAKAEQWSLEQLRRMGVSNGHTESWGEFGMGCGGCARTRDFLPLTFLVCISA